MTDEKVIVTKRGRPLKGERPMSTSERKRDQRMRDKRATIDAIGDEESAPLRVLRRQNPLGLALSALGLKSAVGIIS
jgi:hypothetical protein